MNDHMPASLLHCAIIVSAITLIIHRAARFLLYETQFFNQASSSQPVITCSKLIMEILKQGVKYVQS